MKRNSPSKRIKLIRWMARIWSILVLIFAVMLVISSGLEARDEPLPLIFWLLLGLWCLATLGLVTAWHWELFGGIFALSALFSRELVYLSVSGHIFIDFGKVGLPILLPAVLFILAAVWERKISTQSIIQEDII